MTKLLRYLTRKIRKTPDFLLIGCCKCGTTTLFNYLISHPQIAKPMIKEIHFFSYKYNRGFDWYRMFFPLKTTKKMVFEASTSYLTDKRALYNISESLGSARFLVLLREPLAKTVSLWNQQYGFKDHYQFLDSPYLDYYLDQAKYHIYIRKWFELFEPTRFLFIKSEELFQKPNLTFEKICRFLYIKEITIKERKDNVKFSVVTKEIKEKFGDYFDETKKEVKKLTGLSW